MPFTKESACIERLKQKVAYYKQKLAIREQTIQFLRQEIIELQEQIFKLKGEQYNQLYLTQDNVPDHSLISDFISMICENADRKPTGYRYERMKYFFSLLSFMGPFYFGLLSQNLMFPTYRTCLSWRKELSDQLGLNNAVFDGSVDHIKQIVSICTSSEFDGKVIAMIDAAYVTPYVRIEPNGHVTGIIGIEQISKNLTELLINDESEFQRFLLSQQNSTIKAEFVIMLGPINPIFRPFPVCCISSRSGTASAEILTQFTSLLTNLKISGLDIKGIASDGDNGYLKYSTELIEIIYNNFNEIAECSAVQIQKLNSTYCHFSDPFHLAKRDRYRKASLEFFSISPTQKLPYYSYRSLQALGIHNYILSNEKARKMEDALPLKLFSDKILRKIVETHDIGLLIAMLPSTLFIESLHSENITRQMRIDNLLFGASIVMIYHYTQNYVIKNNLEVYSSRKKEYKKEVCFPSDWCIEYISATINIASLLLDQESIHLGSCGTHFLEHLFGNIRRISKGDDTHQTFIRSMKHVILERFLLNDMNTSPQLPTGRLDSGVFVVGDDQPEYKPMKYYLQLAKMLLNNCIDFREIKGLPDVCNITEKMTIEDFVEIYGLFNVEKYSSISTKSSSMIVTSGLANTRRWKASEQITKLEKYF